MNTTLTLTQLRDRLAAVSRPTPVQLTISTLPKVRNCPFDELRKISTLNCFIRVNYTASMERALDDATTPFVRAPRSWGEWAADCLVKHCGKDGLIHFYLCARVQHKRELAYQVREKSGTTRFVRKAQIEQYLVPERERPFDYREIRLDSIWRVAMNKERFAVVP